ncbi:MAG: hypothetical protein HWN81_00135 [Candidatus Lokiarchaeota archaeon]|nr:hypothetical protein [Candidatus Lokiarchaeota archaeon]
MYIEWREEGESKWRLDRHHTIQKDGTWKVMREISATGRHYGLFGILANVRSDSPFKWKCRGVPKDVSVDLANEIHFDSGWDFHSHSWLTPEEFKESLRRLYCWQERECKHLTTRGVALNEWDMPTDYLKWLGKAASCFYDRSTIPIEERPMKWVSILDYIKHEQDKHNAIQILLKPNNPTKLKARLIFCFDN